MLVEFGNSTSRVGDPDKRVVTYMRIPDEYTFKRDANVEEWRAHLTSAVMRNDGITNFEGGEVLNQLTHPAALPNLHMRGDPDWVWSDDKDAARIASEYYQCPISAADPNDLSLGHDPMVDELYWRLIGATSMAPGVPPAAGAARDIKALLTNVGANQVSFGMSAKSNQATGVGTAATATGLSGATGLTASAWVGAILFVADTTNHEIVFGIVTANTTTAFTVDQWYSISGGVGTTPAAGFEYNVGWFVPPVWFMGISTTLASPAVTDTSLTGEATTLGMGRKITSSIITASTASSSGPPNTSAAVSATYTFSGSSATTFTGLGLFSSLVVATANTMYFETLFSGSFTVTNSGDQATVTDTITTS